jgi:non-specific serine/threonine protein kinase/serine/threonine-protein kinase
MEYVEGIPITTHCDREKLNTEERLRLFLQVCGGVMHAHQKGIVHRDLKASNVLVALRDDDPVPKIIDFGIAKATRPGQGTATALTEQGWVVGTPEYMSPEQTIIGGEDIDTRTDVYSLGVLLYELLAGLPPFDPAELRRASFDEVCRKIREEVPARPSSRIRSAGEMSRELAAARRIDAQQLARRLRGDLDWIVMKALEKDRERRYATVAEMAADIRHHLRHEPVQARSPGTAYRVGKFVRRHRIGVATASVVLVALVAGIIGTTAGMIRARRAEAAALAVEKFLVRSFELPNPDKSQGQTVTARELLDAGAARVRGEFEGQPHVQGRLMAVMGQAYRGLGLYDSALPLLIEALDVKRETFGPQSPEVLDTLNEIGNALMQSDRYEEALPYYEEALEIAERILDPADTALATILKNLGVLHQKFERNELAYTYQKRALDIRRAALGEDNIVVAKSLSSLGHLLARSGKAEEAIPLHEESLEIRRRVLRSPTAPQLGYGHYYLGETLLEADRADEAVEQLGKALEIWITSLGSDHELVGACIFRMAEMHEAAGDLENAELRYREALEFDSRIYPGLDPRVLDALEGYAGFLSRIGRDAEAGELEARAERIRAHVATAEDEAQ